MRASGILFPVFSLPSEYGIGCFDKKAYEFVDFLCDAGQKYWQILPLGSTGYGDSPYQSFSTFAGNPYMIDLNSLIEEGLLSKKECKAADFGKDAGHIDYEKLYNNRFTLLRKAYERAKVWENEGFLQFQKKNAYWLRDYALFMALKKFFGGSMWTEWPEDIRCRYGYSIDYYNKELYYDVEFYEYAQYLFYTQWSELKKYANEKGISFIGDIPIYVAFDSADTWAHRELFQLNDDGTPKAVAGCPPDGFSATGQLWGNPLYDWEYHRNTGYEWWIKRLKNCYELYDAVRIDHFRGFDEFYSIPYGDKTAENGHWCKGPGIELFNAVKNALGDSKHIIAEDLGYLTDSVKKLVKDSGYPGMKVLEFAFDSRDSSGPVSYLPHNYIRNCVVYTGTHDNETLMGWLNNITRQEISDVKKYFQADENDDLIKISQRMIAAAVASVADLCIIPLQDYLFYGNEARINTPSTMGDNWCWRIASDAYNKETAQNIRALSELYGRYKSSEMV